MVSDEIEQAYHDPFRYRVHVTLASKTKFEVELLGDITNNQYR